MVPYGLVALADKRGDRRWAALHARDGAAGEARKQTVFQPNGLKKYIFLILSDIEKQFYI